MKNKRQQPKNYSSTKSSQYTRISREKELKNKNDIKTIIDRLSPNCQIYIEPTKKKNSSNIDNFFIKFIFLEKYDNLLKDKNKDLIISTIQNYYNIRVSGSNEKNQLKDLSNYLLSMVKLKYDKKETIDYELKTYLNCFGYCIFSEDVEKELIWKEEIERAWKVNLKKKKIINVMLSRTIKYLESEKGFKFYYSCYHKNETNSILIKKIEYPKSFQTSDNNYCETKNDF